LQCHSQDGRIERKIRREIVIDLKYSLVIEATEDPTFFGFYSPDLEGFTGIGHSIEDCVYQAKWGMEEHIELLKEQSLPIPPKNPDPRIVIQNQEALARVFVEKILDPAHEGVGDWRLDSSCWRSLLRNSL
jgi:predicted RNase H-like HicB family nuclease